MKLSLVILVVLCLVNYSVSGQTRPLTKIYIYNAYSDYQLNIDPNNRLKIGSKGKYGYALLETDLDSLGFQDPTGQTVYLVVEAGKTYYYGYEPSNGAYKDMTPNAFCLSVATASKYYRRYSITRQAGIVKIQ